ncbi:MAG: ribose-phosphate pyrophosphokinase [Phycisphaerales bacterium]|nr:ribose-phosphate pyrophosphokinase [Phycisphaerales bacterium]
MSWDEANGLKIFAGRNMIELAMKISRHLGLPLGAARTDRFPDGELIVRIEEDVRGRDCFVVLSTCGPVNDNLMELLIFADSLRRASARRITAVIPYFGYGRQDRKDRGRTPITAKLVANLITTAGFDRVLALDLHAAQIQGFFDLPVDHLAAGSVLLPHLSNLFTQGSAPLTVVSPDVGNMKIAEKYAELLNADLAVIYKRRISGSEVVSTQIVGDVQGRTVLMVDDLISTGSTICAAAQLLQKAGAGAMYVAASHGVFVGPATERIKDSPIERVVVTNSIPDNGRLAPIADKVDVICVSKLFADAINHIHKNQSVSALFRSFAESKR